MVVFPTNEEEPWQWSPTCAGDVHALLEILPVSAAWLDRCTELAESYAARSRAGQDVVLPWARLIGLVATAARREGRGERRLNLSAWADIQRGVWRRHRALAEGGDGRTRETALTRAEAALERVAVSDRALQAQARMNLGLLKADLGLHFDRKGSYGDADRYWDDALKLLSRAAASFQPGVGSQDPRRAHAWAAGKLNRGGVGVERVMRARAGLGQLDTEKATMMQLLEDARDDLRGAVVQLKGPVRRGQVASWWRTAALYNLWRLHSLATEFDDHSAAVEARDAFLELEAAYAGLDQEGRDTLERYLPGFAEQVLRTGADGGAGQSRA